jgi:hypothetical protein
MPGYDGTGPDGLGPYGRGLGPCGEGVSGRGRGFFGFRRGRRGGGRFFGSWSYRRPINDREALEAEKGWLERQLDIVNDALGGNQQE